MCIEREGEREREREGEEREIITLHYGENVQGLNFHFL